MSGAFGMNTTKYREKLQDTRRNDLEHTEMMNRICALGNKTLEDFRKLCKQDQETFMAQYTK
jgi:hypothetical protein